MDQLSLRIRFIDALKADRYMPVIIGAGMAIAVYRGVSIESALTMGIPAAVAIWLGVAIFETRSSYLTLSGHGLMFRNRWLKPIEKKWREPIRVEEKKTAKYQCHEIIDPLSGQSAKVPKVIFTYPEVASFILENAPAKHGVRKLVENKP